MRRLLLPLFASAALALPARADPLIGYLLAVNDSTLGIGGRLTVSAPALVEMSRRLHVSGSVIQFGGGYSDYYRVGGLENPGSSYASGVSGSAWTSRQRSIPWFAGLSGENRRLRLAYDTEQAAQAYRSERMFWTTTLQSGIRFRQITSLGEIGLTSDDRVEPGVALGYHYPRVGSLFLHWQCDYQELDSDLGWRGNLASFTITGRREQAGLIAQLKPLAGLRADVKLRRDQFIREQEENHSTTLEPWGEQWSYHGLIAIEPSQWSFVAGLRGTTLSAQAYGDKGELQYAKLTRAEADVSSAFASISHFGSDRTRERLLEFEYLNWSADARGHTEFWPFTSGFVDLLGLRRYFVAGAAGNITRWHVAVREPVRSNLTLEGGLNFADLNIRADIEHWRPEYLYFGKTDVQYQRLDLYRAWIGGLSAGAKWTVGSFELRYAFTQLLPIQTWHTAESEDSVSEPATPARRPLEYGGALHRLSVKYIL